MCTGAPATEILKAERSGNLCVAKHKGKPLHVAPCSETLTIGALAVKDVVSNAFAGAVVDREFLLSIKGAWTWRGVPAGEGPLQFGIAHSDYTAAEIEEALEATGSWSEVNQIAAEQSRRKVRIVGVIDDEDADGEMAFNEGQLTKTTCKWVQANGTGLQLWARNLGGATLTTGSTLQFDGDAYLRRM